MILMILATDMKVRPGPARPGPSSEARSHWGALGRGGAIISALGRAGFAERGRLAGSRPARPTAKRLRPVDNAAMTARAAGGRGIPPAVP